MVKEHSILRTISSYFILLLGYIFIYLPIFIMVLGSFYEFEAGSILNFKNFTLKWYYKMFSSDQMMHSLKNSLIIAIIATFLSCVMATLLVAGSVWLRLKIAFDLFKPAAILPEIILAIGLLTFFSFVKIKLGIISLIIGHSIIGLGIAIPILKNSLEQMDVVLVEAAMDLGAGYLRVLQDIILPKLRSTIGYVSFIIFMMSLDDFFIAYFCAGSSVSTISTFVYSQIRALPDPSLNALSTIILSISSIAVFTTVFFKNFSRFFR